MDTMQIEMNGIVMMCGLGIFTNMMRGTTNGMWLILMMNNIQITIAASLILAALIFLIGDNPFIMMSSMVILLCGTLMYCLRI